MTALNAIEPDASAHTLCERYGDNPGYLLQILWRMQDRHGCIPPAAVTVICDRLGLPIGVVNGVIEFYAFLHHEARGRFDILLSDSITDHMLGSREIAGVLCERLGVQPGAPRADGRVSFDYTSCTGLSDQGPAGLVNGWALTRLDPARVETIAGLVETETPLPAWPREFFEVRNNIRLRGSLLTLDQVPGAGLRQVLDSQSDSLVTALERARLRGRGGAGFPTARKWALCRDTDSAIRHVVCNADEGEPGTFKDRVLLQDYPDLMIEGMTLCARAIGARRGYIYLRGEYRYLLDSLEERLRSLRETGLLGERILGIDGFDFDIEIHLGAGAYICGEESALIESLEGRRGVPRIRPPFPVTRGYQGRPTVVDNVETFVAVARIAVKGADWFAAHGTRHSTGTKLLSVSGDCARSGIYEYPWGVTIAEVLADCGAEDAQAVQVAGPAGTCLPAREFGRRLAFEDVATGGSFMIFGPQRDILDVTRNFSAFFAHESCGFCTPCRVGTALMRDLVDKIRRGHGTRYDLQTLRRIADTTRHTAHCGLGHTAPNPVLDLLDKFDASLAPRLREGEFRPGFDLDAALQEARQLARYQNTRANREDLA